MRRACLNVCLICSVVIATQGIAAQQTGSNSGASIKPIDQPKQVTPEKTQDSETQRNPEREGPRIYLKDEQLKRRLLDRAKQAQKEQDQQSRTTSTQTTRTTVSTPRQSESSDSNPEAGTDQLAHSNADSETSETKESGLSEESQARINAITGGDQSLGTLFRNAPGRTQNGEAEDSEGGSGGLFSGGWVLRTLGALGIIIALIFATRWFLMKKNGIKSGGSGRKLASGFLGIGNRGAVEVIERTAIGNKTQVVLVRINNRVLAISQCGQSVSTLCEITDPNEVAGLIGQKESQEENSRSREFSSYLDEAERGEVESGSIAKLGSNDSEYLVDRARHSVSGLNGLIRNLKGKAG